MMSWISEQPPAASRYEANLRIPTGGFPRISGSIWTNNDSCQGRCRSRPLADAPVLDRTLASARRARSVVAGHRRIAPIRLACHCAEIAPRCRLHVDANVVTARIVLSIDARTSARETYVRCVGQRLVVKNIMHRRCVKPVSAMPPLEQCSSGPPRTLRYAAAAVPTLAIRSVTTCITGAAPEPEPELAVRSLTRQ